MRPDLGRFIGKIPGAEAVRRVRKNIERMTIEPPEVVAHARLILSGEIEPTPRELQTYRQYLNTIDNLQGRVAPNLNQEELLNDYLGHLRKVVERADKRSSKPTHA